MTSETYLNILGWVSIALLVLYLMMSYVIWKAGK